MKETFRLSIAPIERFVFSAPALTDVKAVGRVWCLFEVAMALHLGKNIKISCNDLDRGSSAKPSLKRLLSLIRKGPEAMRVDVRLAEATRSEDKEGILSMVETDIPDGSDGMNRILFEYLLAEYYGRLLLEASSCNHVAALDALFEAYPGIDLAFADYVGFTSMHFAVREHAVDAIRWLARHGVSVNGPPSTNGGLHPVHLVYNQYSGRSVESACATAQVLAELGVDIHVRSMYGEPITYEYGDSVEAKASKQRVLTVLQTTTHKRKGALCCCIS